MREGMDRLLGDLPVVLICRAHCVDIVIALAAKQSIAATTTCSPVDSRLGAARCPGMTGKRLKIIRPL